MISASILAMMPFTACDLEADAGSIRGVVFYADDATIVPNPWVAIYTSAAPDVIFTLVEGDELGRFAATVPEGDYIALASTDPSRAACVPNIP